MHLFAQDRDRLLARLRRKLRKRFEVPAEVVEDIIQLHGYRIKSCQNLPSSMLGCCHFDDKLVLIPNSLAIRLNHPQSAPKVVLSVLAHELGHIRLHARRARAGEREAAWEDEADHYAQVFLVPWQQLIARREVGLLMRPTSRCQKSLWSYVLRLANYFRVSGAFMVRALERYGLIDFCGKSRHISPRPRRVDAQAQAA
jgi:hypothetical protein